MNNNPVRYTDPTGHDVECGMGDFTCSINPHINSTIRIFHYRQAGNELQGGRSLGTRIGPITLSSHDHFEDGTYNLSLEGASNREFSDAYGNTTTENGTRFGVTHYPRFESTVINVPSLITTSASISPIANSSTINSISEGDRVSIVYWDEEGERYVERGFNVGDTNSRQIILDDPLGFITHGDSGGPIFFNGGLIGHVDQINQGIIIGYWLPGPVVNPGYNHHGR
jgi:hypothetical protein